MSTVKEFLESYNKLDTFMRKKLNYDMTVSHSKLIAEMSKKDQIFSRLESKLQAYRALRNAIVHIHHEGETPIAMPNEEVVIDYRKIVSYALSPPLAIDSIAIRNVIYLNWESKLSYAHALMKKKGISILPIVENKKIEGIFSSWHLQKFILESKDHFHRDLILKEMDFVMKLHESTHYNQMEFRIDFQCSTITVDDIVACFLNSAKSGNYFKAVFLTKSGTSKDEVEGVITPHCLPSINPEIIDKSLMT